MTNFELRPLESGETVPFRGFTFPGYRHLLRLEPHVHALEDSLLPEGRPLVSPFAIGGFAGSEPAGLLLGAIPDVFVEEEKLDRNPQILSLFVAPAYRNQGLGSKLVAEAEEEIRRRGQRHVHGVYMTGKPSIPFVERIFENEGWRAPRFRFATVRFGANRLLQADWIRRIPTIKGYETIPWREIGDEEKAGAQERHQTTPWIHPALRFWDYAPDLAEPRTSLGIRYKDELVGWVLNHTFQDSRLLRFTCTWVRWDLARLGLALPAVARSIARMPEAGFSEGTFCTPEDLQGMRRAVAKYVAPWADFVGETRGVYKRLI